jgi:hypothetical protein
MGASYKIDGRIKKIKAMGLSIYRSWKNNQP